MGGSVSRRRLGPVQDGPGDRVSELLLGGGGVAEHRRLVETGAGDHSSDLGALEGERAGLVEENRVDLRHQLERPPVLDEDALLGAEAERGQHAEGRRHADAGAEVAVDDRGGPAHPDRGHPDRGQRQGRDDGLVGHLLAPRLGAERVAGGALEDLGDPGRGGLEARGRHPDAHGAGQHDRGGEDRVPHALLGRRRLAREDVLVDQGGALDDLAVDGHDLAGGDHHGIAEAELLERDLDLHPVTPHADEPRLLAEDVQQPPPGVAPCLLEELAAGAEAPGQHGAREELPRQETDDDDDGVEHVHPEPAFLQGVAGTPKGRDGRIHEGESAQRPEGPHPELAHGGQSE